MTENDIKKGSTGAAKVLIVLCIILSCAIIAAAVIIPAVISENQKKLSANQEMTSVIDNIRQNINSDHDIDGDYTYYWVENIDAYTQKGEGLMTSEYVNQELKDEYTQLVEKAEYYKTMNDIDNNIGSEKYATANRMLNNIADNKPYNEAKWEKALRDRLDENMCRKLNFERIEKVMKQLMSEQGIVNTYKDISEDELTDYPREPYGICGLLSVEDYLKASGKGSIVISTEQDGTTVYPYLSAECYFEETKKGEVYAAFVFKGGGAYESRYYKYENRITSPNGDYRDF